MKIGDPTVIIKDHQPSVPVNPARSSNDDAAAAAAAAPGTAAESGAKVVLSNTAASLLSPANAVPTEFDAEKVAHIAQAIADGKFTVNAESIADKLIANAQELLNSVGS